MITKIRKRDGRLVDYDIGKIENAIAKAIKQKKNGGFFIPPPFSQCGAYFHLPRTHTGFRHIGRFSGNAPALPRRKRSEADFLFPQDQTIAGFLPGIAGEAACRPKALQRKSS